MLKRSLAFTLSLLVAAVCFAGCGNGSSSDAASADSTSSAESQTDSTSGGDSSTADSTDGSSTEEKTHPEASLTIDGEKVDTSDLVVLTVDGIDIDFDTFRYYYYYVLNVYNLTPDTVTEDVFPDVLSNTVNQLKQEFVTHKIAREEKIELDEEDKKNIENDISTIKSQYESEEAFVEGMKDYYLTEDVLRSMEEMTALYQKVYAKVLTHDGKYAIKEKDFRKLLKDKDNYARVKHILVPYYSQAELDDETQKQFDSLDLASKNGLKQQAYQQLNDADQEKCQKAAKKIADEVLQKVKDGEDFDKLIKEYGWDSGMEMESTKDGYCVTPDSKFVQEFKDASFKLKEGEYTEELVVNQSYGYFIIKRLPFDDEFVDAHIDSMKEEYDKANIKSLYNELMEEMDVKLSDTYSKLTYQSIK